MNLKPTLYISIILIYSCIEPTLISDKDCAGVIGGKAVVDDCGYCTGGTTRLQFNYFFGCDGECLGSQFDCTYPGDSICTFSDPPESCQLSCNGEYIADCLGDCVRKDLAKENDLCGVCDPCGDGTKYEACYNWNTSCNGCTDPNAACNSFDNTAIVYEEGSCESSSFYCDIDTTTGLLDINTIIDLTTTESDTCYLASDVNSCGPGENICNFFDCNSNTDIDSSLFIPCNPQLMLLDTAIPVNTLDIGNGECDYYGFENGISLNISSCPEFEYDGGDCDLIDCRGVHFSDLLCKIEFESDPIIDTLVNSIPDSVVIQTSKLITHIGGCTDAEYIDITTIETQYNYNSVDDTVISIIDTTTVGIRGWMGDGECDSDGVLFDDFGLDFNCIKYDYEGGDCNSLGRVIPHAKNKSNSKRFYKIGKKKINLN